MTQKTSTQILAEIASLFADNSVGAITPERLRTVCNDLTDSTVFIDAISGALDATFGSAQGSILMRNATGWDVLLPGTAGSYLTSNGTGADLDWTSQFHFDEPISVGNLDPPVDRSGNSWILISRTTADDETQHGFSDCTTLTAKAGQAYNSYDSQVIVTGSENYDHYCCFQNFFTYTGSGTITRVNTLNSAPQINAGTVTTMAHVIINDAVGAGSVINNYGIFAGDFTKGSGDNYFIYISGTDPTPSFHKGPIYSSSPWVGKIAMSDVGSFSVSTNGTAVTITAANIIGGLCQRTGAPGGAVADTFPTGPALADALNQQAGNVLMLNHGFLLRYLNQTGQVITVTSPGASCVTSGTMTVANNISAIFLIRITGITANAETYEVRRVDGT